jgi:hypothetical protein
VRLQTPTTLSIHLSVRPSDDTVRVWVATDYLAHVTVHQTMPQPEAMRAGADRVEYTFATTATDQPVQVWFTVEPNRPGLLRGAMGRSEGPAVAVTQMVMP